jgi:hypothetical protein
MRRRLTLAAIIGALALAGCSDNNQAPTEPKAQLDIGVPCPNTAFPLDVANAQITALYPAGTSKKSNPLADALAKAKDIAQKWSKCKVADPQSKVVTFVNKLLSDFRAGSLIGGTSTATATTVSALINTMYSGVGFGTPNLPVGTSGTEFGIGFFTPGQPLLVQTNNRNAAALLAADAFTETTAITIFLRPDTPNPFQGVGPTVLPPFYEITASNLSGTHYLANGKAVVGFCFDDAILGPPSEPTINDPAIAHLAVSEGSNPGGFEILDEASEAQYATLGLDCEQFVPPPVIIGSLFDGGLKGFASAAPRAAARYVRHAAAAMLLPTRLDAAVGKKGLGGLATSFSPFGVTDRAGTFSTVGPTITSELSGATVTRTVHVSNADGSPAAGIPVTFSTTDGSLSGSQPVNTDGSGNASVGWTLLGERGIRTLDASISDPGFAPSSLTFTVAEASSDGQLAALDCDLEGSIRSTEGTTPTNISFENQSGGDVIVNWLDYGGARVFYSTVTPDNSYTQPTYVTHPWIVISDDGEGGYCQGIFLPFSAPAPPGTVGKVVVSTE